MIVKLQTSPSTILLPSGIDESFANALKPSGAEDHTLSIRPAKEFYFETGKKKIIKLADVLPYSDRMVLEMPDDIQGGDAGRLVKLGGVIEWHKQISVLPLEAY